MNYLINLKSYLKVYLGFLFFGLITIIFTIYLPLIFLICLNNKKKFNQSVQNIISFGFKIFLNFLKFIHYINIDYKEIESTSLSKIIIANHISLLDTVIILSIIKNCNVIVNPKFTRNIFLAKIIYSAGYIVLENNSPQNKLSAYQQCIEHIKSGNKILIFPEAHRSLDGNLSKFNKGAFHLSLLLKENISVIYFKSDKPFLTSRTSFDKVKKIIKLKLIYLGEIIPDKEVIFSRKTLNKYTEDSFSFFKERMTL